MGKAKHDNIFSDYDDVCAGCSQHVFDHIHVKTKKYVVCPISEAVWRPSRRRFRRFRYVETSHG